MAKKKTTRKQRRQASKPTVIQSGETSRALALPARILPPAPPVTGGRQTQPTNVNPLGLLSYSFIPRRAWQNIDISNITASQLSSQQLLELLADISPEVSLATWNMLRLVNSGWRYEVTTLNGTRELKSAKGKLDELINRLNPDFGGINTIINSWVLTAYLQGAVAGEIALTEDLQDTDDIYAIQPWTIQFMRDDTQKLIPFQQQVITSNPNNYGIVNSLRRLNSVTFGYIPVDSPPDDPYGRPPAASVLQLIAFDLQFLKDLRQAIHNNAWGRLHIKVMEEAILKNAPPEIQNDPTGESSRNFINAYVQAIRSEITKLKPDDTLITTDAFELDTIDFAGKTFDADKIARLVERRLIRALKQLPVLMGSNEGTTETHGTVQMDIYAAGIKAFQNIVAALLEKLLGVALQVMGIAGKVKWYFDAPRVSDAKAEAEAELALATLAAYLRDQNWITQDDAAIKATGSKAVGEAPAQKVAVPTMPGSKPEDKKPKEDKPEEPDTTDESEEDDQKAA